MSFRGYFLFHTKQLVLQHQKSEVVQDWNEASKTFLTNSLIQVAFLNHQ